MVLNSANKVEANKYELEVVVSGDEYKEALEKSYKKNTAKISVPGFRKGKAPRSTIIKMYGEGFFYEDAVNLSYPKAYEEAVIEAKIEPIDRADVDIISVDGEGYTFKAIVTVKPEVVVLNYKGIKANKTVHTVTDEEINVEIDRQRERSARIVEVTDRAAQNGDNTVIDFDGYVDGVAFEGGKADGFALTLGSGQFIPGFEAQIEGRNIGEEFDVNVTFPEDYHSEDLKGKEAVFKVKLVELKGKELPQVDDEFAKDVSEFDNLIEFKADIAKKLQERADRISNDEFENQLIDGVLEGVEIEIPQVMIEQAIDNIVSDFEHRLQSQGMDIKTYMQYTGMDLESFRKTFEEQAQKRVKIRLVLEKIAEIEGIVVSDLEVDAEYTKMSEMYNIELEKVKSFVNPLDIKKDIAINNAIELIRENAVITTVDEKKEETV